MKLKQLVGGVTIASALSAAAFGVGTGAAYADPGHPGDPGGGHGAPANPGGGGAPGGGGPGGAPGGDHGAPLGAPAGGHPGGGPGGLGGGPGAPPPGGHPGDPGPGDYGRGGPGGPADHGPGGPGDHAPGGPGDRGPGGPAPWHGDAQRGYFHDAPWGDGPAPWGPGEPPRPDWGRPLPPPGGEWRDGPINYYGYQEKPVWNPQFNQWGFDFFGVWVPL